MTSDDETAVCNLGSVNLGRLRPRRRARLRAPGRGRPRRRSPSSTGSSTSTSTRRRAAAASNARWRPVGLGMMGLQDVFFQLAAALRLATRRAGCLSALRRGDLLPRAVAFDRARRGQRRRTETFAETQRRRRGDCSSTCGESSRPTPSAGSRCASASPGSACATRCSSPSRRPPRSPRSPTATSPSSRRSPTCSSARRSRASSSRSTPTSSATCNASGCGPRRSGRAIKRSRRLGPGDRRRSLPKCRPSFAPPGRCLMRALIDMAAERGAVHRPEPVAQPVRRVARPSASSPRCTCTPGNKG